MQLIQCHVIVGDWERKDAGFCHSYHRTAPEERRKAKEDASEDDIYIYLFILILHLFSTFCRKLERTRV